MIIFYVSYCYARYEKQFEEVENIMRCIVHDCVLARKNFEVHTRARWLGLPFLMRRLLMFPKLGRAHAFPGPRPGA